MIVTKCPQCNYVVDTAAKKCGRCLAALRDDFLDNPKNLNTNEVENLIKFYKASSQAPNFSSFHALGRCYIQLRLYGEAIKVLEEALEALHKNQGQVKKLDAPIYFNLSVARLGGRRPRILSKPEVNRIETSLETASDIDPEMGGADLLLAFVRYDFYRMNCLRFAGRSPEELTDSAQRKILNIEDLKWFKNWYGHCVENPVALTALHLIKSCKN